MLQYERQQAVMDFLKQHHTATIHTLARQLYTSEASIRRDIAALEAAGLVVKVYGGVILPEHKNEVVPVELREGANSAAKEVIALEAAKLIHDGDTVFFDSSSTVRRICKHIKNRKHLKIITNNVRICHELKDTDITVYCTGGEYYKKLDELHADRELVNEIQKYNARICQNREFQAEWERTKQRNMDELVQELRDEYDRSTRV